jgi:AcrR family transcriptional regulator
MTFVNADSKRPFSNVKWKLNGCSVILSPANLRTETNMSPRPRETSDQQIIDATARVMQRRSPTQLTLADVAKEAGVVPATLIQRFGTKRALLLAACSTGPAAIPQQFAAARAKHPSPLKALVELYADCSSFAPTPEAVANGLAYLQIDLTDPEFHAITLAQFRAIRAETTKLLDEAVAARELHVCDTAALARLIQQVNDGAMLSWAVYRQGSLAAWVRHDVENLLAPHRVASNRVRHSPAKRLLPSQKHTKT